MVPGLAMNVLSGKPVVKALTNRVHQEVKNVIKELTGKKQIKRKNAKKTKKKRQ